MQINKFKLQPCGITIRGIPSLEEWAEVCTYITNISRSYMFWLGDMQIMGEAVHGDDIYQAYDETTSIKQAMRAAKVCREFPPGERCPTLSFTHHQILVGLPKELQKAMLARAELEGMDTAALRELVSELKKDLT